MQLLRIMLAVTALIASSSPGQDVLRPESDVAAPMPPSGSTTTFNYWKSGPTSGYYVVQSSANTGFSFMVSDNFLGLVLTSAPVDDKTRLSMLAQYPFFMNALYEGHMATNYPDATKGYDQPFEAVEAEGLSIRQDDLALQRDIGNRKAAVGFIEGDHCGSVNGRCGISLFAEHQRQGHRKAGGMCSADQLLRVGALHPLKTGVKSVGLLAQRPAFCRHGAFAMLQVAFPVR